MFVGSKTTRSNARFPLADLEDDMSSGLLAVKKEKIPPFAPTKKTQLDLPQNPS